MHILWVKTELLHPLDKGGKIRTYQTLRHLARNHRVTYATLDDGHAAPDARQLAAEYSQALLAVPFQAPARGSAGFYLALAGNGLSRLPYAIARYRSAALRQAVQQRVMQGGVDVVVGDFLVSAVNLPPALDCATVLFQHNVEAEIWRRHAEVASSPLARWYFRMQWRRMAAFEASACARFDRVAAVSELDAEHLRREYRCATASAVPTGVDTEYFTPAPFAARDPLSLVFTGSLDWMPNEDGLVFFLEEVMPGLRERVPGVTLSIVGRDPTPRLKSLAAAHPDVRLEGRVPDVRPYLAKAGAVIVPLRVGGGTRLKIYEAMATGAPVVSTSIGAEGLPLRPGEHFELADGAEALRDACTRLLLDRERAARVGQSGSDFVHGNCSWGVASAGFQSVCEAAIVAAQDRRRRT